MTLVRRADINVSRTLPVRLTHGHALAIRRFDCEQGRRPPAYDVLPSAQGLGYQQFRVGADAGDSTLDNALSMCTQFGLKPTAAKREVRLVAKVVASWRQHFASAGVTGSDIELLAEHIDRPFLRDQRDQYAR